MVSYSGYRITRLDVQVDPQNEKQISEEHFFDIFFENTAEKDFYFIQIGANDGKTKDFLHKYVDKYKLKGLFIEPQKDVFEKLLSSYRHNEQVSFANIAIGKEDGVKQLYTVKPALRTEDNFFAVTGIASFNKEVFETTVMKKVPHLIEYVSGDIEDYADIVDVKSLTFTNLIDLYKIRHIDYLQIDCEGYDFEIIKMINFDQIRPKVINFESKWMSHNDREVCENILSSHGYKFFRHGYDTCAYTLS